MEGLVAVAGLVDAFEQRRDVADARDPWLRDNLCIEGEEHALEIDWIAAGFRKLVEQAVRVDGSVRESPDRGHFGGIPVYTVQQEGASQQVRHQQTPVVFVHAVVDDAESFDPTAQIRPSLLVRAQRLFEIDCAVLLDVGAVELSVEGEEDLLVRRRE